jgi:hypothetical protein
MKIVVSSVEKAANSAGQGLPSLWGRRASCLSVHPRLTTGRQDARQPRSQEGCVPQSGIAFHSGSDFGLNKPEMFESLASCFAFRCSASLNMRAAFIRCGSQMFL